MNSSRLKPLKRRLTASQRRVRKGHQEVRRLNAGRCVKCGQWIPLADRNTTPCKGWIAT